MKIKLIAPPVIDVSGLMRSPQSDIGILFGLLEGYFSDHEVSMKDFRFYYYDNFYESYRKKTSFRKEMFFQHQDIIESVLSSSESPFKSSLDSLFHSFFEEFEGVDILIIPISIFEQFSLEYFLSGISCASFFKTYFPNTKVFLFGTYRTIYAQSIMKHFPFIDGIVKDGDKEAIKDLIVFFLGDDSRSLSNCIYRSQGHIHDLPTKKIDISIDPYPSYHGFDLSVHKQEENKLVLSYELGQGCRNNCFYCYNVHKGGKYVVKSVEKITHELSDLKEEYSTELFHFDDNEINYSNTFLFDLSSCFIQQKLGIFWTALIIPRDLSYELLLQLYLAGCRQLRFGIESGSQRILDIIGKKTSLPEIERILSDCKKIGIATYATFIVDLPQEQEEDIRQTLKFIFKNKDILDYIVICAYNTHLGTFDIAYFESLFHSEKIVSDRTKRISRKKLLLRKFCDTLGKYDVDVIQFMKHHLGK